MGFIKKIIYKVVNSLKSLYRKRLIFFSVLIGVALIVALLFVFPTLKKPVKEETPQKVQLAIRDFFIDIPKGAFPKEKEFNVSYISPDELTLLKEKYHFISNVYSVVPKDNRKEFAYVPIKLKMYFSPEYFLGDEYVNLSLAYIDGSGPPNLFPGSSIGKDDRGYYVEASAFHASKIGIVSLPPKKQEHGLKLIREVLTPKPAIIIVPGEDPKFSGELGEENFWEQVFPDRTIYVYKYPVVEPRSLNYMREAKEFFKRTGSESYVMYEAEKFAEELISPEYSRRQYHIIAHGIGGLIVRLALESHPEIRNVRKVVLVSVPSKGTNVANPLYFASFVYNTNPESAPQLLGLTKLMFSNIKLHIFNFIETVNDYYKDLLPDSMVVRKLKSSMPREDLNYIVILGKDPPFDIDVKGSVLEKIYPELVKGNGDGVVSVDSAKMPDVPFFQFNGSFDSYYTRSDVVNLIKSFIDTDKVPQPPELESDIYREYESPEVIEREGLPPKKEKTKVEEKPATSTIVKASFTEPSEFIYESILAKETSFSLKTFKYTSGGCVIDEPYFATHEGIFQMSELFVGDAKYDFMKGYRSILTLLKDGKTVCKIDPVGYKEVKSYEGLLSDNISDIYVTPEGKIFAVSISGSGGIVKLMIYDNGYKLVDKSQGTYGKIIPLEDKKFIFLSNKMLILLDHNGNVINKISLSSLVDRYVGIDATYAYKVGDYYFVLTRDYYLLIYNEKTGESQVLGRGWIGSLKIIYYKERNVLLILGKKWINFVDLNSMEILKYVQPVGYEIVDGFLCGGKLYVIGKEDMGYRVYVYTIGPGML